MFSFDDLRDLAGTAGTTRAGAAGASSARDTSGAHHSEPFIEPEPPSPGAGESGPEGIRCFTFTGSATPRIAIGGIDGRLRVRPHEEPGIAGESVTVRATDETGAAVPLERYAEVTFSPASGVLRIEAAGALRRQFHQVLRGVDFRRGSLSEQLIELVQTLGSLGIHWPTIDIEATVPRRCDLELSSASGPIDVEGIEGSTELRTASGSARVAALSGNLTTRAASGPLHVGTTTGTIHVKSVSGGVTLAQVTGNLIVHTVNGAVVGSDLSGSFGFKSVSGDLHVDRSCFEQLYVSSTSGDCAIDATFLTGDHEFRTVSGDITLRPQTHFGARLSGRTVSGALVCDLPYRRADRGTGAQAGDGRLSTDPRDNRTRRSRRRWDYLIGDLEAAERGDTRVRVRTVSGALTIVPGGGAPDRPPTVTNTARDRTVAAPANGTQRGEEGTEDASTTALPGSAHEADARSAHHERAAEESRLAILEALRHDELSTDEALRLLAELDATS